MPAPAVPDAAIDACKLEGTVGDGGGCGTDGNCDDSRHLINLLSYLSTQTRPKNRGKCLDDKSPKEDLAGAFSCFDEEFANPALGCLRAAVLNSAYASVVLPAERSKVEDEIRAVMERAKITHRCSAPTTLCLDREGAPIGSAKTLQKGDTLTVIVLSVYADDVGTVSISVAGVKATDSLLGPKLAPSGLTRDKGTGLSPPITAYVLASAISDPIGDDVRAIRLTFRRADQIRGKMVQPDPIDLPIERGRYYIDFGLALPFVIAGNRVVTTPALVEQTTAPRVSFSALVFLAGRPKGEIRVHGRAAWGIQIGTDFDFTRSVDQKDYYLGGAWEPIAGFGICAGVALVRGQFIGPTPASSPDQSYMARPYLGVFLTPDFVSSARAAVTALEAE